MESLQSKPSIVSHRGIAPGTIENTKTAFAEVIRLGCDMIELDIHETKDGELILFHDRRLDSRQKPWRELTYSEIQTLVGNDGRASRLADCLAIFGSTPINVEIKSFCNKRRFAQTLMKMQFPQGSFVSSYHYQILSFLNRQGYTVPLMPVIALPKQLKPLFFLGRSFVKLGYNFFPNFYAGVSINESLISKYLVRAVHAKKKKVYVWTANQEHRMRQLMDWGVDGIITNDLRLLQRVRSEKTKGL